MTRSARRTLSCNDIRSTRLSPAAVVYTKSWWSEAKWGDSAIPRRPPSSPGTTPGTRPRTRGRAPGRTSSTRAVSRSVTRALPSPSRARPHGTDSPVATVVVVLTGEGVGEGGAELPGDDGGAGVGEVSAAAGALETTGPDGVPEVHPARATAVATRTAAVARMSPILAVGEYQRAPAA